MKISFVIVEYYSTSDVLQCISSIDAAHLLNNYEIIISSNSCYFDMEREKCIGLFLSDKIRWIFNDINGGFAYAMNRGLEEAEGDLLIIMNPDVRIRSGLNEMLSFFYSQKKIGAIAPRIMSESEVVQDSFRNFITLTNFFVRQVDRVLFSRFFCAKRIDIQKIQLVDWVIGAFIAVKREVYEETKGLDENYFLYCEDMDWCTRIWKSGYEVIYYPQSTIIYEGTRTARKSIKYSKIFLHSLFRYWSKFGFFYITRY